MSICSYAYIELLRKGRDTNYKSFIQGKGNVNKTLTDKHCFLYDSLLTSHSLNVVWRKPLTADKTTVEEGTDSAMM